MSKSSKSSVSELRMPERDPIGPFEHAVEALFEGPLAAVTFPGIDRAVLQVASRATLDAQLEVEAAERALEQARRDLHERASELGKLTKRAVAYARVLAEDDDALAEKLDALVPRAPEAHRVPRKRRARPDEPMLPTLTSEKEGMEEEPVAAE